MKEPLVTISLKEYNKLLEYEKAILTKNKIIVRTWDGYSDVKLFVDDEALSVVKKNMQNCLDEYIDKIEKEHKQVIVKSWMQSIIDSINFK
jgi:hypothetical protein